MLAGPRRRRFERRAEPRARRVVVNECAQEFTREDETLGANVPREASEFEAERREWDWGA